jgi:predicted Zn-dependent peptidase
MINFSLPNGVRVVLHELPYTESFAFSLLLGGGLALEEESLAGSATALTEILSRGAGPYDAVSLSREYEINGISHSEEVLSDRFIFRASGLKDKLPRALELLRHIILDPALPEEELPSLKLSMEQELSALLDDPTERCLMELRARYYPTAYGRSTYGNLNGIKETTKRDLLKLWERAIKAPSEGVFSIAGNFKGLEVKELLFNLFSEWSSTINSLPPFGDLQKPGKHHLPQESAQLQLAFAMPSVSATNELYYAAKVANSILTNASMSGRLFVKVREERGLCYRVFSSHVASRYAGSVIAYAGTTPERALETYEVILEVMKGLYGTATEEEIAASVINLKAADIIGQESSFNRAKRNAEDLWNYGKIRELSEINRALSCVGREEVDAYFKAFPHEPHTIVTLGATQI